MMSSSLSYCIYMTMGGSLNLKQKAEKMLTRRPPCVPRVEKLFTVKKLSSSDNNEWSVKTGPEQIISQWILLSTSLAAVLLNTVNNPEPATRTLNTVATPLKKSSPGLVQV